MRKIVSRREDAKKKRRNQLIVGIVLVFIMLFSVLGYAFQPNTGPGSSDTVIYNGYEFENQNGLWVLNLGGFSFVFRYNPEQVERIDGDVKTLENYYQKPLYISSENQETETEVYANFRQVALRTQPACIVNETCIDEELPLKTCEDNLIVIQEADTNEIYQEENCVFIRGSREDIIMVVDEFLFKALGITS